MAALGGVPGGIDELRHRYAAQPRRYLAPLADALRRQGALEEAVTMLRAQLAEYPEHLTGHVVLGQALFDTGALSEARTAFERARTLDPGNALVLRHLGDIASLGGDAAGARVWFGRLRAAEPYADDVAAQLGGGGEPPAAYDEEDAPVAVDAASEVVEPPPAAALPSEPFELLEFEPALDAPALDAPALDPVVGLDEPPAAAPAELRAGLGEDVDHASPLDQVVDGPFATETMAGLLAAQGHTDRAVAIYERLVAERPDDAELRGRLDALRGAPAAAPAVAPPAAPASDDAARGALLAAAFADLPARAVGVADAPPVAAVEVEDPFADHPFADVPFNRRFPPESTPESVAVQAAVRAPAQDGDEPDLARFDAWLRAAPGAVPA